MTKKSTLTINHFVALVTLEQFEESPKFVKNLADEIVKKMNLHVVDTVSHQFKPQGSTFVYILSESHLIIHTWPEFGKIHIDIETCSDHKNSDFKKTLNEAFSKYSVGSIEIKNPNFNLD